MSAISEIMSLCDTIHDSAFSLMTMAEVFIPLLLRDVTGGARRAQVDGTTLAEVIVALDTLYPGIEARICNGGKIGPNVALTVDGKIAARALATPVDPDSQVNVLPAFGGG